jgi:hypothetical protein
MSVAEVIGDEVSIRCIQEILRGVATQVARRRGLNRARSLYGSSSSQ